ncbi:dTMP kinase [Streptomyces sp. NPDC003435]
MSSTRSGFFLSVDGPSGVGKSTTLKELHALLDRRGTSARLTTEPPHDFLGDFTRAHAGQLHSLSLACLVAAARYRHIETTVEPALTAGDLLICDRYVPSSLVLQQLDGVPLDFLLDLNRLAPAPDLAVLLTASPGTIASRIAEAGVTHRFRADPTGPAREVRLYEEVAAVLAAADTKVLLIDTSDIPPSEVARRIADAIPAVPLPSKASSPTPITQEP